MGTSDATNSKEVPSVCVVTQPARRQTSKTHAHQLLDILAASTSVVLLTSNLSLDAPVRDDHEVVELADKGTGGSLPVEALRFLKMQFLMAQALATREEDIIHFFGSTTYLLPILLAKTIGKTVIVQPRGDVPLSLRLRWENQMPEILSRLLVSPLILLEHAGYTLADAIVTYTPAMAEQLGLQRYEQKLFTDAIRYVDIEQFAPRNPFSERPTTVGYLGRLDAEKNIPLLVEVAKQLPDGVNFRFVGDGDYREVVERELATEISNGDVTLTGRVNHSDVPAELNEMRLLILSSEPTEGLPTVILESFACGTPVYATSVSGIPDVVIENETGFLLTEDDAETISETITNAISSKSLAEMSTKCRSIAESDFNFRSSVNRYRQILESVQT